MAGKGLWMGSVDGVWGISGQQQRAQPSSSIKIINCAMCWQLSCQLCGDRDTDELSGGVDRLLSYSAS